MTSTALVGGTGLVVSKLLFYSSLPLLPIFSSIQYLILTAFQQGSYILSTLLSLPSISSVHSLARRQPSSTDAKLSSAVSADSGQWPSQLASIKPVPGIFYSALGTTRAAAGSLENQRKIDYDLNLALAKAAKDSGVKVYVLISSSGANSKASFAYMLVYLPSIRFSYE